MKKGYKLLEETRQKMSESHKGYKFSQEAKNKMSKAKIGKSTWNKGKRLSEEHRKNLSLSHKGQLKSKNAYKFPKGEKHPFWQGGKSFEPYATDWNETLKRAIRERDNYICQLCSQYGNTVHHINYNKKNCNPDNLINLCQKCHIKTNFNRNYWITYFNTN